MTPVPTSGAGLALGGGTARGMAHVGVLKGLAAAGERPRAYAGGSFGAIIAALAALGLPVSEIERLVTSQDLRRLWAQALDPGLHRGALVDGGRLAAWLDRVLFAGARIEEAERPLAIAATDLADGRPVVLRAGPVALAVRASCALPGLFAPVVIEGRALVDGGFAEPVPFGALAALRPGPALGVHAGLDLERTATLARLRRLDAGPVGRALHRAGARGRGEGTFGRLLSGLSLSLRSYRNEARAPAGSVLLTVDPGVAWWDFHRAPTAIEAGERAVRRWLLSGRPDGEPPAPVAVALGSIDALGGADEEPA